MIKLLWEWRKVDIMLIASSLTKMTTIAKKNTKIAKKRDKNSPKMTMLLREGEEVDITCTVHASPPAIVTWMKGQAKLKSSGR